MTMIDTKTAADKLGCSPTLLLRHAKEWGINLIPKNPNSIRKTYVVDQSEVDEHLIKKINHTSAEVKRYEL